MRAERRPEIKRWEESLRVERKRGRVSKGEEEKNGEEGTNLDSLFDKQTYRR